MCDCVDEFNTACFCSIRPTASDIAKAHENKEIQQLITEGATRLKRRGRKQTQQPGFIKGMPAHTYKRLYYEQFRPEYTTHELNAINEIGSAYIWYMKTEKKQPYRVIRDKLPKSIGEISKRFRQLTADNYGESDEWRRCRPFVCDGLRASPLGPLEWAQV